MKFVLTYTTTTNHRLNLSKHDYLYKGHKFNNNVGYVTLLSDEIPNGMFERCKTLQKVVVPQGVKRIGEEAFSYCDNLEVVELHDDLEWIGLFAFYNCIRLTSISIPNGVKVIEGRAFDNCTKLKSIVIPNSVTDIGNAVFNGCKSLSSVVIPNSVTRIGNGVFYDCKSLPCYKIDRYKRPILAYKGFDYNMSCRGFKFEIGKTYHEDIAVTCQCGFHACLNPLDVLTYYPNRYCNKFALVELSGGIYFRNLDNGDSKVAATDIKIVKELSYEELINETNKMLNKC